MNKILRISVFTLLTLVSNLTFAKVIFDAKTDIKEEKSITKDGVVVSVDQGVLNNGKEYRIYKGATIQISANQNISSVVFNCTKAGKTNYGSLKENLQIFHQHQGMPFTKKRQKLKVVKIT